MAALALACKVAAQNDASLYLILVVAIPAHSTEMPPEALKPYLEHEAKLMLGQLAGELVPGPIGSETVTAADLRGERSSQRPRIRMPN